MAGLTDLDLTGNVIAADGAQTLAAAPSLSNLTRLGLRGCFITDAGAQAMAASPHLSRLAIINLGMNDVSAEGAQALAASPYLTDAAKRKALESVGFSYLVRTIAQGPNGEPSGRPANSRRPRKATPDSPGRCPEVRPQDGLIPAPGNSESRSKPKP
jgi:Leucine Rich repeat